MRKWLVQVEFTASKEIAVEAENAREAEEKALGIVEDPEEFEVAYVEAFRDWEAEEELLSDKYEFADGYFDGPEEEEEEEEFEPGRTYVDVMGLNP